jgi:putative transposase
MTSTLPGKDGIERFWERVSAESLELVQERPHRSARSGGVAQPQRLKRRFVVKTTRRTLPAAPGGVQEHRHLLSPQRFPGIRPMKRIFQPLLAVLAVATDRQLARHVQFLKEDNQILRSRAPKRLILTPQERRRLMKLGQPLGLEVRDLITSVTYPTYLRWVREAKTSIKKKRNAKPVGRPKKPLALRELILKIASQSGWGYTRVLGEIRKLTSRQVSRQTVANIMRAEGLDPGPKRGEKTWDEFIKIHADSLWQCDFFCKRVWTLKGLRDFYVLAFLHVGTRRVWTSPCTEHPDNTWVCQQAEAFCEHITDNDLPADIVFHDADTKFTHDFDATLKGHGLRPRRLPICAPNMNACWVQSIEVERLDHFIVLGDKHLDYLVSEYVSYYHTARPHQGLHNRLILPAKPPDGDVPRLKQIVCHEQLGGLLKHFERRAA